MLLPDFEAVAFEVPFEAVALFFVIGLDFADYFYGFFYAGLLPFFTGAFY